MSSKSSLVRIISSIYTTNIIIDLLVRLTNKEWSDDDCMNLILWKNKVILANYCLLACYKTY